MFSLFARHTWGGQIPTRSGSINPNATIVFSPMIKKAIGKVKIRKIMGKNK